MSELIVVTGPPGAGKSAVARLLAERFDSSVLLAGDSFFGFLASGAIEPWLPAAQEQNTVVVGAAAAAAGRYVAGDFVTIYDGVLGPWFLDEFLAQTGLAAVHYAVLLPTVEQCVVRVAGRTGHGFTDEAATRTMHREFMEATIDRRHVLGNSPGTADDTVTQIIDCLQSRSLRYPPQQ